MRKLVIITASAILTLATLSIAQDTENPIIGKWLCDMSRQADLVVDLEITADTFHVFVTSGLEVTEMAGTYKFENNKVMFTIQTGDITETAEGEYLPDTDQLSVYYQEMLYTFERVKPVEKAEEKDPD
jgi:hypothetical protein